MTAGPLKLLFVYPPFKSINPRSIRVRNISAFLKDNNQVHVLCFEGDHSPIQQTGIAVHEIKYSWLSRWIFFKDQFKNKIKSPFLRLFSKGLNYILHPFQFPDRWILEKNSLNRHVLLLDKQNGYDVIIIVAIPFSSFRLIDKKALLRNHPLLIADIGDPLYQNRSKKVNRFKEWLKFRFEKKYLPQFDQVIVTNDQTRNHYKTTFELPDENIKVISQGVDLNIFLNEHPISKVEYNHVHLVYAGIFYKTLRESKHLVSVLKQLGREGFPIKTTLVGSNLTKANLNGVVGVKQLHRLSQEELVTFYKEANLLLFVDNSEGNQTPGKIFELLALMKPILFLYNSEISPTKKMVEGFDFVLFCKNEFDSIYHTLKSLNGNQFTYTFDFAIHDHGWKAKGLSYQRLINMKV